MNFIERVLEELELQNKSKADLARFLNTQNSQISIWISRGTVPAADIAVKIAKFLNTTVEYLVTGEREQKQEPKTTDISKIRKLINDDVLRFYNDYCILDERDKQTVETVLESLVSRYTDSETKSS